MKMFLISDNVDTQTGMRLAGVEGVVVHEREELYDTQQIEFIFQCFDKFIILITM